MREQGNLTPDTLRATAQRPGAEEPLLTARFTWPPRRITLAIFRQPAALFKISQAFRGGVRLIDSFSPPLDPRLPPHWRPGLFCQNINKKRLNISQCLVILADICFHASRQRESSAGTGDFRVAL
jgi:hypothetical protein